MIIKIAWRNIWRNKTRSFTVMGSVVIGVTSIIFLIAFSGGFINSFVQSSIETELSHLQIHHPKFQEEEEAQYVLTKASSLLEKIQVLPAVKAAGSRSLYNGMLANANGSRGVLIKGVDPLTEAMLTHLDRKIQDGKYLKDQRRNPVLIGEKLAEKLKLKVRSKIILTIQDASGELTSAAFKVCGIYNTGNALLDEQQLFVRQSDIDRLLDSEDQLHEVAVILHDIEQLDTTKQLLQTIANAQLVETYREISPQVNLYETQMQTINSIVIMIVMLALIFGIINTMLMAVLERTKELGVLMAIGMKRKEIFSMIVTETVLIGLIAMPIGLLIATGLVLYYSKTGIDLSAYSQGMSEFGLQDKIYPTLDLTACLQVSFAVIITSILGAIYPAIKATSLKPVEAIRKI
jgi:putative ABC transport system permease protein